MAKAKKKSATKKKSTNLLLKEIPQLNSMVFVLYFLLGILFLAIYLTRFV